MSVEVFLEKLLSELAKAKVDVQQYAIDHVCYRVATAAEYEERKAYWNAHAELLHEAMVNGRPIAAYRLREPIRFRERVIPLLELPFPKPGSPYVTGWEHAEFVVPEGLPALLARYPQLPWDKSAMGKKLNPEVRLAFAANLSAKFHPLALDEVIRLETT